MSGGQNEPFVDPRIERLEAMVETLTQALIDVDGRLKSVEAELAQAGGAWLSRFGPGEGAGDDPRS